MLTVGRSVDSSIWAEGRTQEKWTIIACIVRADAYWMESVAAVKQIH